MTCVPGIRHQRVEFGRDHFLPGPFQFTIHSYSVIQHCVVCIADSIFEETTDKNLTEVK